MFTAGGDEDELECVCVCVCVWDGKQKWLEESVCGMVSAVCVCVCVCAVIYALGLMRYSCYSVWVNTESEREG